MTQEVVGQRYDSEKNQLPYGGAVDINGNIVWAVTKEEALATRERMVVCHVFCKSLAPYPDPFTPQS